MKTKDTISGVAASFGMLVLILDGKTALTGAQEGIELCLRTVIPSLFPFFLLSILMTNSVCRSTLIFLQPIRKLCRLPKGTEAILLSGFLGGYPVGAQCVSHAYKGGNLTKQDAEKMLAFSNNAGPAFLFGMVAAMFSQRKTCWILWSIHLISAILTARLFPLRQDLFNSISREPMTISQALQSAIHTMSLVCGWIILFRVVLTIAKRWFLWLCPVPLQVILIGLLELSNGCCDLLLIENESIRFLACSGMLAFGGLCVTMQTMAVTKGLSLRFYFMGKLLQTFFSLILSWSVIFYGWQISIMLTLIFLFLPEMIQKRSRIPRVLGV